MSNLNKILFLTLILIIFIVFNLQANSKKTSKIIPTLETEKNLSDLLKQKEKEEANVSIAVKPIILKPASNAKFSVEFSTHSVNLDFNIPDIVRLTDNLGNDYGIPQWDGSRPGGHHRSGTLTFSEKLDSAKKVSLVFENVADIPERKFNWDL